MRDAPAQNTNNQQCAYLAADFVHETLRQQRQGAMLRCGTNEGSDIGRINADQLQPLRDNEDSRPWRC